MPHHRRRFLQATAAAAALTTFSRVTRAANSRVALGVIGTGGRGSFLLHLALAHQACDVVALADVNQRNLARAAQAVANAAGRPPRTAGDFRRLLDDAAIDGVIVATPHHWHCPIALCALQAGKHVYLEKPASHVFAEGRLLVETAARHRRLVQHGTQMRSSEVTAEAEKVLRSGLLGKIVQAKAWGVEPRQHPQAVPDSSPPEFLDYDFWLGPAPLRPFNTLRFQRWNSYRDYGNGEIGGDGVHDIDLARWGLGATTHPVHIVALGSRAALPGESDFPDNLTVTYLYADGRVLIYENRNFAPYGMHGWDNGNVFYGTQGYMVFSRRGYFQTYLGPKEEPGPGLRGGTGNAEHVGNFIESILAGTNPRADAATAHLSCALVHLGEIAYRTGRAIRFDPQTETIEGDEEASALLTKTYRSPWQFEERQTTK
jgi:predicted dehydrogenase